MQINFILQGKGGVGKSYIATLMAQYYREKKIASVCFDTDPVNQTFSQFQNLKVSSLDILEDEEINSRKFDDLVEYILNEPEETERFIIDSGASSFVPLCSYMVQSKIVEILEKANHEVLFHSVITGGSALNDTVNGLIAISEHFPKNQIVVWINEYFGKTSKSNTSFQESSTYLYLQEQNRIYSTITLPALKQETFGYDVGHMLSKHLTFAEAVQSPEFNIVAKQRLFQVWNNLFTEIEKAKI